MLPEDIHARCKGAAQAAADKEQIRLGDESKRGFDCGSAWLIIRPARGPFVRYLKERGLGDKGCYGGLNMSAYRMHGHQTQSVSVHEAAATAYAAELVKLLPGCTVEVGSRLS